MFITADMEMKRTNPSEPAFFFKHNIWYASKRLTWQANGDEYKYGDILIKLDITNERQNIITVTLSSEAKKIKFGTNAEMKDWFNKIKAEITGNS